MVFIVCVAPAFAQPAALAARSKQAHDAMAEGRYDEATAIYAELSKALPTDAGLLMNLGMAHAMAGRQRDAIPQLERAVKLDPSLHPAWLFLGSAYLETGQAAEAVAPLEKAVATNATSVEARQLLADAFLSLERFEAAGRALRALLAIDAENAAAWYALGQSHEAQAREAFEALRTAAPESAYELVLAGDVQLAQLEYSQAVDFYRAALEKQPGLRQAQQGIVEVYEAVGNTEQAAAERKALEALPAADCARAAAECAYAAGRFADAAAAAGKRRDAVSHFWRARAHNELALEAFSRLEQLPASPESHAFRAELYRAQGRHPDSVAELRKAEALAPGDPRIQRELATSLYLSRDYAAAEPLLARLLKADPASVELNFLYGDTLLQSQEFARALAPLEAAVRGDSTLVEARASLARAYLGLGRHADAIPHLKAALATDEDGSLHQLARAYQAIGEGELAKQMMGRYLELTQKK